MSPTKRNNLDNPPPQHASNTPEALEYLPPSAPYGQPSFPLPPGFPQLNGAPTPAPPPHPYIDDDELLVDLPPSRIGGLPAMTALPPACPRTRPDGERIGGAREVEWERDQERSGRAARGETEEEEEIEELSGVGRGRSILRQPSARRVFRSQARTIEGGVGVGSPWSSLERELSENSVDPTILMVEPRAPSPSRPSFLSIFLHLLTRPFTLLSTLLQHLFANRLFAPASPRVEFADDDLDALD